MKIPALALSIVLASLLPALADADWGTDYKAALAEAKKDGKPILMDFTGSDWCGWCIKLVKDTFSKPEFKQFASKNLVLLELDYPNAKKQSDDVKKQNQQLQSQYNVEGFPTLVLLSPEGKEIARNVGYLEGGPDALVKWVEAAEKK